MLAIIQARMSSRRLPGKVLRPLAGQPMLGWVIARVSGAQKLSRITVATSKDSSDEPVASYCEREGIACHRGPLDDVAERFAGAAATAKANAFVRITGDSPLMDPAIIDEAVALYETGDWDLVSNVVARSFPIGQSVEVIRTQAFDKVRRSATEPAQREHVTQYFYANSGSFRIKGFTSGTDASGVQLSVDTPEDFEAAERLIALSDGKPGTWRELANLKEELA